MDTKVVLAAFPSGSRALSGAELSVAVALSFACSNLIQVDAFSKSDPFVAVSNADNTRLYGHTEFILDHVTTDAPSLHHHRVLIDECCVVYAV